MASAEEVMSALISMNDRERERAETEMRLNFLPKGKGREGGQSIIL